MAQSKTLRTDRLATGRRQIGWFIKSAGRNGVRVIGHNMPAALSILALLVIWQVVVTAFQISDFIIPAPTAILQVIVQYLPQLLLNTETTLSEIGIGFVTGNLIAILSALIIVNSRFAERATYPLIVISQTIPQVAIAPLFLIWFGPGMTSKVVITAVICFFPTVINTVQGLKATDPDAINLLRVVAASRIQMFWKLQLPNALPNIFAGLKISITLSVLAAVVGEWVGANSGLGWIILYSTQTLRISLMFAALFFVSLLALSLYAVVVILERLFSWQVSQPPVATS